MFLDDESRCGHESRKLSGYGVKPFDQCRELVWVISDGPVVGPGLRGAAPGLPSRGRAGRGPEPSPPRPSGGQARY